MAKMSPYHWGEFHTHAFHVVPSMGPIVSVMNLQGWQTHSRKANLSTKPGNVIHGVIMALPGLVDWSAFLKRVLTTL